LRAALAGLVHARGRMEPQYRLDPMVARLGRRALERRA
jgi:hypothetical protein